MVLEPSIHQILDKMTTHDLVLGGGLNEAQRDFLPIDGYSQSDDHLLFTEGLSIENEPNEIQVFK